MQYTLVRSKKRRRSVAMQLSPQGELIVRAPQYMPRFFIDRFVAGHTDWIDKQKRVQQKPKPVLKPYFSSVTDLEQYIHTQVDHYSNVTGLKPTRVRFRHVKSYWGSCSPSGVISFNHHLLYAPSEAVDYVIVHELCHLKYRGHGLRFWDLVTRYYPKQNEMRLILRHIARD